MDYEKHCLHFGKLRLAVLNFANLTAVLCFVLTPILLTNSVSAKTFPATEIRTNSFKLNDLTFSKNSSRNSAKMCNLAKSDEPAPEVGGDVVYFVCYVACRAAGHSASFCINSCSLIADPPIINLTENTSSADSKMTSKNGGKQMKKELSPERTKELKVSVILFEASMFGHKQTIREMLDFGANVNVKVSDIYVESEGVFNKKAAFTRLGKNDTPLLAAIKYGAETEAIKLLLERGAEANIEVESGKTPLKLATEKGRTDVVQLLLESGAN